MKAIISTLFFIISSFNIENIQSATNENSPSKKGTTNPYKMGPKPSKPGDMNRPASPILSELPMTDLKATLPNGKISRGDIKNWLYHTSIYKSLNPGTKTPGCLKIKELLGPNEGPIGTLTASQVFLISTVCHAKNKEWGPRLLFVVKIYNKDKYAFQEIESFDVIKKTPGLTHLSRRYPRLALPEKIYQYDNQGDIGYVSVIHGAKGHSLFDLLQMHSKTLIKIENAGALGSDRSLPLRAKVLLKRKAAQEREGLLKAARTLGINIANLHIRLMDPKTCKYKKHISSKDKQKAKSAFGCKLRIHDDLHLKNIFWDGRYISLIDVEGYGKEPLAAGMLQDAMGLLASFYRMTNSNFTEVSRPVYQKIATDFLTTFYVAYFKAYRKNTNAIHFKAVKDLFLQYGFGAAVAKGLNDRGSLGDMARYGWENINDAVKPIS